jgi:hypothetical protein
VRISLGSLTIFVLDGLWGSRSREAARPQNPRAFEGPGWLGSSCETLPWCDPKIRVKDGPTMLLKTKGDRFFQILTLAPFRFRSAGSEMREARKVS